MVHARVGVLRVVETAHPYVLIAVLEDVLEPAIMCARLIAHRIVLVIVRVVVI